MRRILVFFGGDKSFMSCLSPCVHADAAGEPAVHPLLVSQGEFCGKLCGVSDGGGEERNEKGSARLKNGPKKYIKVVF